MNLGGSKSEERVGGGGGGFKDVISTTSKSHFPLFYMLRSSRPPASKYSRQNSIPGTLQVSRLMHKIKLSCKQNNFL